jgi:hypothetical protein
MQLADTLIAIFGDLIASKEKAPLSKVSRKQRSFSSTVHIWYSTARPQTLGHSSIMSSSSTVFRSGRLAFKVMLLHT